MSIFDLHSQEESEMITTPVGELASPERKVVQILGPEVFSGISGGLDTLGMIIFHPSVHPSIRPFIQSFYIHVFILQTHLDIGKIDGPMGCSFLPAVEAAVAWQMVLMTWPWWKIINGPKI